MSPARPGWRVPTGPAWRVMAGTAMREFDAGHGQAAVLAGARGLSIVGYSGGMTPAQARQLAAILAEGATLAERVTAELAHDDDGARLARDEHAAELARESEGGDDAPPVD